MAIPVRQKSWFKVLLSLLILMVVLGAAAWYLVNYRVRDIIQVLVNKESKGVYGFDASSVDISFANKNIIISNARLYARDTVNTSPHYEVTVPRLYFAIQSWREVLFQKKVTIDSLFVLNPQIKSHDHLARKAKATPASFHASGITETIEKLLVQLQVRTFHIQDASFVFTRVGSPVALEGDHINFTVSNFSRKDHSANRLLSSDDINLTMDAQHWVLPDGKHDISFKRLHFSGKNQFFELDSCIFNTAATAEKGMMTLRADKLFFNSKELAALYQKDELLIDTLICFRPSLHIETTTRNNKKTDSSASVSQALSQIFTTIHFNYIDVKDGELSLINTYNPNYSTQKANVKAYNLHISKNSRPSVSTDSILLNLQNLEFLTTDSLFKMTVGTFSLNNNDVVFKNAVYAPTARNHADKGFTFVTPLLHLRNINLAALMNKKIMADTAILLQPAITVFDRSKHHLPPDSMDQPAKAPVAKKKGFYQTLHGLNELIDVQHFNIINGNLGYTASGMAAMKMSMKKMNAHILLDRLFLSDSLIDIKRSLPQFSTASISVQSPKLSLSVSNYHFNGITRHNSADKFQMELANGTTVTGKQLYWEILDWDMYANHKIIQVEYLKLEELAVNINKKEQSTAAPAVAKKDLPVLHIARLNLNHLQLQNTSAKNTMSLHARDVAIDHIGSKKTFFTWNNAEGFVSNVVFNNNTGTAASIDSLHFNTQSESVAQHVKVDINNHRGYTKVYLPHTTIKTDIHSTDFSSVKLPLLRADNASIDILKKQAVPHQAAAVKPLTVPVALASGSLIINGKVKYTQESVKDTLSITAIINVDGTGVSSFKKQQQLFSYDTMMLALSDVRAAKGSLGIQLPRTVFSFTKGAAAKNNEGKLALSTGAMAVWNDVSIALKQTDSTGIDASLSGSFNDDNFQLSQGAKLNWQSLVYKTTINKGAGQYKGKNIVANAGSVRWQPSADKLSLGDFFVVPTRNMQETFAKPGAWQGDYMVVKGHAVDISGIRYNRQGEDSSLRVKKIFLDSISLTTTRDKRMPFRHGIEKLMPVAMINALKMPLQIDSIVAQRSQVMVNEIAIKSEKQGTVPLNDINVVITNFKNRRNGTDSLTMVANARLLNYKINHFYYKEAYADSLSSFLAGVHVSQMALPEFSTVTIPLASVSVANGNADTLFARWTGNKYAAVGKMDFYYQGLKIRLLDAKDNSRKKFLLSLGNFAAGLILHKKNDETTSMFFMRDREKFIFNYWVKTILAGVSTSAGIKRSKKMLKKYRQAKDQYSLPVFSD